MEFTKEIWDAILKGIRQENIDHGRQPPQVLKCSRCQNRTPREKEPAPNVVTCKRYPQGIPKMILGEKEICEEYKQNI